MAAHKRVFWEAGALGLFTPCLMDVHLSSSIFLLSVLGHIPMCPISYKGFPVCRTEEEAVVGHFFPCSSESAWPFAPSKVGVWGVALWEQPGCCGISPLLLWDGRACCWGPTSGGCEEGAGSLLLLCRKPQQTCEGDSWSGLPTEWGFSLALYLSKALIEGLESPTHGVSMGRPPAAAAITALLAGFEEQH